MRWWSRPAREGEPRAWINGILFLGTPWASPQVALRLSRQSSVCAFITVGGADADAGFTVGFGLGTFDVTIERCFPAAWRERAAAWAERTAKQLNAQYMLRPEESSLVYAHQLDPFAPMGRTTGVMWCEGTVVTYAWANGDWSRNDARRAPWHGNGWAWHLDVVRWIFGREVRRARIVAEGATSIAMPEGSYPATYTIEAVEVSRPRARTTRHWCGNVEVPDGIPFPGKGENSYDCGEDAAYGLSLGFDHLPTPEEVCGALVASVTASRGDWTPEIAP